MNQEDTCYIRDAADVCKMLTAGLNESKQVCEDPVHQFSIAV